MIERCTVGGQHLDLSRLGVQIGGRYSPPCPEPLPKIAAGGGLLLRTDSPVAEMALRSATTARAMDILLRSALQKGSTR